jgi:hypothetical protein
MIGCMKKAKNTPQRGNSYSLYDCLSRELTDLLGSKVTNVKQLANLIWMVASVIQGNTIALSQLATFLPGNAQAESRVTRVRRWLMNQHVDAWEWYRTLLEHVLKGWREACLVVMVDGTMVFGDRLQIFRLSLVHGNRAIPLWWIVTPGKGLVKAEKLAAMFEQVALFLQPYSQQVICLADRGFRAHDWAELCVQVGWHYRIRITRNTQIWLRTGSPVRLDSLGVRPGHILCLNQVTLTLQHQFVTNVSMTWSRGDATHDPELVIVISDQRAHPDRLCEYALRMDIEQSFRDDKSGGFDIDHTRLNDPERLSRLLLVVAIATVWCHELGEFVLQDGEVTRRMIDPGDSRELSIFQLGLRWLNRCLAVMLDALPRFRARLSNIVLPPVRQSHHPAKV